MSEALPDDEYGDRSQMTDFEVNHFANYGISQLERYAEYRRIEREAVAELDGYAQAHHMSDADYGHYLALAKYELAVTAIRNNHTTPDEAGARLGYEPTTLATAAAELPEPQYLAQADEAYRQQPPDDLDGPAS